MCCKSNYKTIYLYSTTGVHGALQSAEHRTVPNLKNLHSDSTKGNRGCEGE